MNEASSDRCLIAVSGIALLGSVLVIVGTWMEWPLFGPFYEGPIPGILSVDGIDRGYQPIDIPTVLAGLAGGVGMTRYRRRAWAARLGIGAGVATFLLAVGHTLVVGAHNPFRLVWGFRVTLGGAGVLVVAGLLRGRVCDSTGHRDGSR